MVARRVRRECVEVPNGVSSCILDEGKHVEIDRVVTCTCEQSTVSSLSKKFKCIYIHVSETSKVTRANSAGS